MLVFQVKDLLSQLVIVFKALRATHQQGYVSKSLKSKQLHPLPALPRHDSLEFDSNCRHYSFPLPVSCHRNPHLNFSKSKLVFPETVSQEGAASGRRGRIPNKKELCSPASPPSSPTQASRCGQINCCQPSQDSRPLRAFTNTNTSKISNTITIQKLLLALSNFFFYINGIENSKYLF